jgi:Arc/MetJ family transcription regulator
MGGEFVQRTRNVYKGYRRYTSEAVMRTNIEIDDELLKDAMEATGQTTKRATVEEALRRLVKDHELKRTIAEMKGLGWEGDLDEMRRNFFRDFP